MSCHKSRIQFITLLCTLFTDSHSYSIYSGLCGVSLIHSLKVYVTYVCYILSAVYNYIMYAHSVLDMLTSDSFKLFCMLTAEVIFSIIMLFLVYNGLKCIANRIHVSMS